MQKIQSIAFVLLLLAFLAMSSLGADVPVYEISGSPFATEGAPVPEKVSGHAEKVIVVYPSDNFWGAYDATGHLVRWGIATAGAAQCADSAGPCKTKTGYFRIYSLGSESCVSQKYANASMPYCMYFNGGQAIHGSSDVQFDNISHGCVRVHIEDAKWLRYHFVEGPTFINHFRGTLVFIQSY